jgi:hypothetical protein
MNQTIMRYNRGISSLPLVMWFMAVQRLWFIQRVTAYICSHWYQKLVRMC